MTDNVPQPEPSGLSVVVAMFQHNAWANLKLLDFCAGLSAEQLAATAAGTYGAIRDTLNHIVQAEASYVARVNGKRPPSLPENTPFAGIAPLRDAAAWTSAEMLQLALGARTDTLVIERWPEATEQYKLADLLTQAINHANEHRAQIATVLTHLGLEPPDMSGWQWMLDTGAYKVEQTSGPSR